jgi:uncharacterized protein (DUF433 family)
VSTPVVTEYHYITTTPGICGGQPVVKGTRTPVRSIVGYCKLGLSVEEILEGLPHLTAAQVFEALSYYHDHQAEIEGGIADSRLESIVDRYGLTVTPDGRIVFREAS